MFGRLSFARSGSLFAFCLVLFCGSEFKAGAQQTRPSPQDNTVPVLPAAKPISEAAVGSPGSDTDSTKSAQSGASANPVAAADNSSSLRLGPGDLLEIGVYNVPELTSKA